MTSGTATTCYYLGDTLAAKKTGTTLDYLLQDSLGSTTVLANSSGAQDGTTVGYLPFGVSRNSPPYPSTDKLFTGQRLDSTGLYFYNARYYDPTIGRFISADTEVPHPGNPQSLNRYSYVLNNPLKSVDPTGHDDEMQVLYDYMMELGQLGTGDQNGGNNAAVSGPTDLPQFDETGQTSPGWTSFTGLQVPFGPKNVDAWTPNLVSDATRGWTGGIQIADLTAAGTVTIGSSSGNWWASADLTGILTDESSELHSSAYIEPLPPTLLYETNGGNQGSIQLGGTTPNLLADGTPSTPSDFNLSWTTSDSVPSPNDCRYMTVQFNFKVVDTVERDYDVEEGPTFLRPSGFAVNIFEMKSGWWPW